MSLHKKNNAVHQGFDLEARCRVRKFVLGDKEIAVKIRGNSHYRNFAYMLSNQVGMLIVLRPVKVSWANWGDWVEAAESRLPCPFRAQRRALLFYPFGVK